jgi:hypothetical protein
VGSESEQATGKADSSQQKILTTEETEQDRENTDAEGWIKLLAEEVELPTTD